MTSPKRPFIDCSEICGDWPFKSEAPHLAFADSTNRWAVLVWDVDSEQFKGSLRVGIAKKHISKTGKVTDVEIISNWSTIQSIKNEFWPNRIAIEIYPPKEQLVDQAPMRWLWVLPETAELPFNLHVNAGPLKGGVGSGGGSE